MPNDALIRSWTGNAAAWTHAVRSGHIESRRLGTDAAMLRALEALAPTRLLDLGCGEGWLCRALAAQGVDVVGVDVSAPLVEAARAAGPGRYVVLGYGELAGTADLGLFDAVACNFALLDDALVGTLVDLRGLLAPGGHCVIQTVHPWAACGNAPYREGWRMETFDGFADQPFPEPMPWYFRTLASWLDAVATAGFSLVKLQEPAHPESGGPLSLLMIIAPRT